MVQTRKQADVEAQAAVPAVPASIVDLASSTPASAPPKGGGAKKPSPKKATPRKATAKKATVKKPSPDSLSPKYTVKDRSITSGEEYGSNNDGTARDGKVARDTQTPAPKKGLMKKKAEGIIEARSNGDDIEDIEDIDLAELAKKKGKAKPKAMRTKRAVESDNAENDDAPGAGERPKKRIKTKKPDNSPPRNVPINSGADPDETEAEEDLDQKMKAYEKRKHKQAATNRKAPSTDAEEGQQSAEPPRKKTKRSAARHAANDEDGPHDEPPEGMASDGRIKRATAATVKKAPSINAREGPQSAEPPKKKAKRSAARSAAAEEDGPRDEPPQGMPSGGRSKRAAVATKKPAKGPKPQAKPVVGTRRSARISDNPVVSPHGAEDSTKRRPMKMRFRRRAKTPEMPKNNIGLDENEIFSPRFPTEKPKPAKVVKKTRNGDRVSTNGKKNDLSGKKKD